MWRTSCFCHDCTMHDLWLTLCWLMLAVPSISFLQASWLLWIAAGIVLNASLQWKHLFPGVLQDALHYGKLKLDVRGGGQTLGLLNLPKSYAIRSLAEIALLAFEKMLFSCHMYWSQGLRPFGYRNWSPKGMGSWLQVVTHNSSF